jgi:hypothetical protein
MKTDKKSELLKALKKERPKAGKFNHNIVVMEQKKISEKLGMLRFDWYADDKLEGSGSLAFPIPNQTEGKTDQWAKLGVGQSEFYALSLDFKAKSLAQMVGGFFRRSLEEGKLQDLLPFGKSKG